MSMSINDIKYNNSDHVFITKIGDDNSNNTSVKTIGDLLARYRKIFINDKIEGDGNCFSGPEYLNKVIKQLNKILQTTISIEAIKNDTSSFLGMCQKINAKNIDSICLEGYRAYSFYLEKIINLLIKIDDAVKQGQDAISKIENINLADRSLDQTEEEYVNSKVHELSSQFYLADKAIADAKVEFEKCLQYNTNTKSWDLIQNGNGNNFLNGVFWESGKLMYSTGNNQELTIDNLRNLPVNDGKRTITCFSELNLIDRLKYIRYYYEIITSGKDNNYQIFPDDAETGYPCIPDKKSETDTKATENMGGFELFYVGYLVDRDGSIDAYSSCLEAKSTAITNNLSLQSKHIEAYNQYLRFINRATQLLNESQSDGHKAIAYGAHLGLTYFGGGTMRDLLEIEGVNYIVLSYTDKEGNKDILEKGSDFNYGSYNRYLLVRADEYGLNALYDTDTSGMKYNHWGNPIAGNGRDPNGLNANNLNHLEIITTKDLEWLFKGYEGDKPCVYDCKYNPYEGKKDADIPPLFKDTKFYRRVTSQNSATQTIVSSTEEKREILIWEIISPTEEEVDVKAKEMYPDDWEYFTEDQKTNARNEARKALEAERHKKYLPKQLIIQEIEPDSVAQYENYTDPNAWGDDAEAKNRVINSWTTAFSNKSDYINTAIETINTDITSLRTKMDTIDSLCSTLRNRSFETKKTLISNLRS